MSFEGLSLLMTPYSSGSPLSFSYEHTDLHSNLYLQIELLNYITLNYWNEYPLIFILLKVLNSFTNIEVFESRKD